MSLTAAKIRSRFTERRRRLQRRASTRATAAVRDAVGRLDDRRVERLASGRVLAAIFSGMRSRYVPAAGGGFAGAITYELRDMRGRTRAWTVNVTPAGARVVAGTDLEAALTILVGVADFVRLATGELDPGYLLLSGRMDLRGDMAVAMRLGSMFGR